MSTKPASFSKKRRMVYNLGEIRTMNTDLPEDVTDAIETVENYLENNTNYNPEKFPSLTFNEENNLEETLDSELLGSGRHRSTYAINDEYVIKVGKSIANRKEVEAYNNIPDDVKKYLCPMVEHCENFRWVVMRRVDEVYEHCYNNDYPPSYLSDKMTENDIDMSDVIGKNVGRLGHRLVIIDYAEYNGSVCLADRKN